MAREIERKFLVKVPPDPDTVAGSDRLKQGYLAVDGPVEVRLRETGGSTTMTIKGGSGLSRAEVEISLDGADADALWPFASDRSVHKVRHRVPLADGLLAEVDVYEAPLAPLVVVEVEFSDPDTAAKFTPPDWFGRELTGEKGWSNAELAMHGIPG